MTERLTFAELDKQLAAIQRETARRLELVPVPQAHGDWAALMRKHSEMLAILESSRDRKADLRPPADRADAYRRYVAAIDRQLVLERAVLAAAQSEDFDTYSCACRTLAGSLRDVQAAGRDSGLRRTAPTAAQRAGIWITLPWYIVRAHRHARAERAAGRDWRSA
ncbi:MAG: hypothetical protein M3401_12290 [Actinomycetota bacterium]|nr:hypothetical protein [Actinomycetota bacterium]